MARPLLSFLFCFCLARPIRAVQNVLARPLYTALLPQPTQTFSQNIQNIQKYIEELNLFKIFRSYLFTKKGM